MDQAGQRREFAAFLRARRERLDPRELGLPVTGPRRTPGLRREELALLAGVSVDYYVRLEQGRDLRPSSSVLTALARALQLGPDEREHLFRLGRAESVPRRAPAPQQVRESVLRLLTALEPNAAFVLGRGLDVLAWNRISAALLTDFAAVPAAHRNMVRLVFLHPGVRDVYADWVHVARDSVGYLRSAVGRYPDDAALTALVGELSVKSEEFRTWWSQQDVMQKRGGTKTFAHPLVGRLVLDYDALTLQEDDQQLIVYTAPAGSPEQASLELLATLAVSA